MIIVKMLQYWNDYHKNERTEKFRDLKELEDWIFSQMCVNYSSEVGKRMLSFPECDTKSRIYRISVRPDYGGCTYWIELIEDTNRGIIFSDGTYTAGQKHCTKVIREWLAECRRRKEHPVFRFAKDDTGADLDSGSMETNSKECASISYHSKYHAVTDVEKPQDDNVLERIIKRAIRRIHDAGGCDAEDEYGRGYDAAIGIAIDILLEESGYDIEDVIDYEESEAS